MHHREHRRNSKKTMASDRNIYRHRVDRRVLCIIFGNSCWALCDWYFWICWSFRSKIPSGFGSWWLRHGSNRILGRIKGINMFKKSDQFILLAVAISFAVSGFLWFSGQREEGLFTAVWVPSILCFGIYFKLAILGGQRKWVPQYCLALLSRFSP